uniref:Uncharacterized protein n=1 Tax=Anguilla anguilla TaxID=7936 RepID=A0A0E9WHI7_ANGAN
MTMAGGTRLEDAHSCFLFIYIEARFTLSCRTTHC